MLARLWWKEWRAFGPAWLVLVLAAAGLQWLFLTADGLDVRSGALTPAALAWAVLYAFGVGSASFAGERESGTLGFLDALPVARPTLWLGKATFALASTLGLALLLAGLAALGTKVRNPGEQYGYGTIAWVFGTLLFEAVAWGLLWSSLTRNPLVAGAMGVVSLYASTVAVDRLMTPGHLLALNALVAPEAVPGRLLLASVALGVSALAVILRPRSIAWPAPAGGTGDSPGRPEAVPDRRASAARSLSWQAVREGWTTLALVALVGLVVPIGVALLGSPLAGPMGLFLAVLASLVAGVGVFGEQGGPGPRLFLVHHGVRPGAVWGRRIWTWGLGMAAFLAAFLVAFAIIRRVEATGRVQSEYDLVAVAASLVDAFAVGLVCGMAIPRRLTAAMVGVIGVLAIAPGQVMLATMGMVPGWSLLLTPAILIGVSRAWAGDWMGEREGAWPWARLGLFLAVPLGLLGSSYVAYRAWGVPDVGPQFDLAAARGQAIPPGQDAAEDYRRAVAQLGPGVAPTPAGMELTDTVAETVVERGWNPKQAEVVAWWRENGQALGLARQAAAKPRAQFHSFEGLTLATPSDPVVQEVRRLALLLALDARECLSRGDLPGAWGDILAQLRMAGQLAESTPSIAQLAIAAQVHRRAAGLAIEWAGDPRQSPGSIRAARDDLKRLPPLPSAAAAIRLESMAIDGTLDLPAEEILSLIRGGGTALTTSESLGFSWLIAPPWERVRAKRLGRRRAAEILPEVGREPWERSRQADFDALPAGSPLLRQVFAAFGAVVHVLDRETTRRRALEQVLALRWWQLDHGGEYPGALGDLVPARLDRLPLDPYSGRPFGYVRSEGQKAQPPMSNDYGPSSDLRPTRPGQRLLYSIGPDGVDDGGKVPFELLRGGRGDLIYPLP